MKYIRTKDGRIIDLNRVSKGDKLSHFNEGEVSVGSWAGWYWFSEEYGFELECRDLDIIDQADTIEELCDEFVCEWNVYPALCLLLKRVPKDRQKNIYGAIWTEWGLKYVAKINEKGELELL